MKFFFLSLALVLGLSAPALAYTHHQQDGGNNYCGWNHDRPYC